MRYEIGCTDLPRVRCKRQRRPSIWALCAWLIATVQSLPALADPATSEMRQAFEERAARFLATEELNAASRTFIDESVSGYAYVTENLVGRHSDNVNALIAMERFQVDPHTIFPFSVVPLDPSKPFDAGSYYDLQHARFPGDVGNFVRVTQMDPTSFTFTTLEGHFDGPGATIKFETIDRDGKVFLRQTAFAPNVNFLVAGAAQFGAVKWVWPLQAENLAEALTTYRAKWPNLWDEQPRIHIPLLERTAPAVEMALNTRRELIALPTDELANRLQVELEQSLRQMSVDMERAREDGIRERAELSAYAENIWRGMAARHASFADEHRARVAELNEFAAQMRRRGADAQQHNHARMIELHNRAVVQVSQAAERHAERMKIERERFSKWLDDMRAHSIVRKSLGQEPIQRFAYQPPTFPPANARSTAGAFVEPLRPQPTRADVTPAPVAHAPAPGNFHQPSFHHESGSDASSPVDRATPAPTATGNSNTSTATATKWEHFNPVRDAASGETQWRDGNGRDWICRPPGCDASRDPPPNVPTGEQLRRRIDVESGQ